ncbi:MAG TPA: response regulator, partial [Thermosynechococcaceae cyanobacterium]
IVLKEEAEIFHASTLHQARQQLETDSFDLVILDISLPDGSGLELLPFIHRQTGQPIPVVLFSAREVNAETAQKVTAALTKTRTTNQELLSTIQSLVKYH